MHYGKLHLPPPRKWLRAFSSECPGCGSDMSRNFTVDHIWPRSKGGTDDHENLWLLCWPCNFEKRARPILDWISDPRSRSYSRWIGKLDDAPIGRSIHYVPKARSYHFITLPSGLIQAKQQVLVSEKKLIIDRVPITPIARGAAVMIESGEYTGLAGQVEFYPTPTVARVRTPRGRFDVPVEALYAVVGKVSKTKLLNILKTQSLS